VEGAGIPQFSIARAGNIFTESGWSGAGDLLYGKPTYYHSIELSTIKTYTQETITLPAVSMVMKHGLLP
jgi:hypothetical protein